MIPKIRSLRGPEILSLMREGISLETMSMEPSIQISNISFDAHGNFDFDEGGAPAFIFEVWDCGHFIDFVAWDSREEVLASWCNAAFALGQDDISNPGTYTFDGKLCVYSRVVDYLRGGRQGIIVLKPDEAHHRLRGRSMVCHDAALAPNLQRWMQPPESRHEIYIKEICEEAA